MMHGCAMLSSDVRSCIVHMHVQIVSVIVFSSVMIKKPRVTPERAAVPAARNVTLATSEGL